jgi:TPR repeat protein
MSHKGLGDTLQAKKYLLRAAEQGLPAAGKELKNME